MNVVNYLDLELFAKANRRMSHGAGNLAAYGFAIVAMVVAMGLRNLLTAGFGPGLPPYITFYPMVMAVAILTGCGPGLLATAVSGAITVYYILPPTGQFAISSPIDQVALVFYLAMGLFVSILAEFYRRYRVKASVYDNELKWRENEERFQLIVENTKDYAIFMLDPQGRIASWNAGAERIKGYQAEEIIGQQFSCFYPKESLENHWPEQELHIAEVEGRSEDEGWRLRKDGSRFWAHVVITAIRDDTGLLKGFSKITRDLSQQKQANDLLEDSNRRFEAILESALDGILSVDEDQHIILFNTAAEKIFGCTAHEAIGQSVEQFLSINSRSRYIAHLQQLKGTGTSIHKMGRLDNLMGLRADGSDFPLEASISQTKVASRKIVTIILRDITERKLIEQALDENRENFIHAQEVGQLGWWRMDTVNNVLTFSDESYRIFGITTGTSLTYESFLATLTPRI